MNVHYPTNPEPSTHFLSYDGNGNVIALTDAATAETTAVFEYGPFGELLRATGPMADQMPLRFSTMYADDVTGDVKYLYRDLTTPEGRWTSRDPAGEYGGLNLYGMLDNEALGYVDGDGQRSFSSPQVTVSWPRLPPIEIPIPDDISISWPHLPRIPVVRKSKCGDCGPDISLALASTLGDIRNTFEEWGAAKQAKACATIFYPGTAMDAWDIEPLASESSPRPGEKKCSRTFSVNGKCYYGGSINYIMWGFMVRLCGGDSGGVLTGLGISKRSDLLREVGQQAAEMALYGYSGVNLGLTALNCSVKDSGQLGPIQPMPWVWEPYRSRRD